jgi:uncharacterized membrane protein (DUF373 family)
MAERKLSFGDILAQGEIAIYSILAVLLFLTTLVAVASGAKLLWESLSNWNIATKTLPVLNELLIVLMLVEILHTVRISIRSHVLVTEPFLVVGLIATIRRILVVTLEAATLTREEGWSGSGSSIFRASMVELALLGGLVLVFVVSIAILRRNSSARDADQQAVESL